MADLSHTGAAGAVIPTLADRRFGVFPALSGLRQRTGAVLRAMQTGRMMSVLSSMSDAQLDQIGISRADIPRYAETLMVKE